MAENERLRTEVAALRERRIRRGVLVAGVLALGGLDAWAFGLIRAMINSDSDSRPMVGFALVGALVVGHIWIALRVVSRKD